MGWQEHTSAAVDAAVQGQEGRQAEAGACCGDNPQASCCGTTAAACCTSAATQPTDAACCDREAAHAVVSADARPGGETRSQSDQARDPAS